jgi:two-component system KDP operon response regulator KdpE
VHLTPIEYNLLYTLMRSAGQCVTYKDLIRAVWGDSYAGDYSVLRVNISRLRTKLDDNSRRGASCIVTEAGVGYMLVAN